MILKTLNVVVFGNRLIVKDDGFTRLSVNPGDDDLRFFFEESISAERHHEHTRQVRVVVVVDVQIIVVQKMYMFLEGERGVLNAVLDKTIRTRGGNVAGIDGIPQLGGSVHRIVEAYDHDNTP